MKASVSWHTAAALGGVAWLPSGQVLARSTPGGVLPGIAARWGPSSQTRALLTSPAFGSGGVGPGLASSRQVQQARLQASAKPARLGIAGRATASPTRNGLAHCRMDGLAGALPALAQPMIIVADQRFIGRLLLCRKS